MTTPSPDEMRSVAEVICRLEGCDCDVSIEIIEDSPGVYTANVGHDDGCALLARIERRN